MKSPMLLALALFQSSYVLAGSWVIQPQPNGSIRMLHEGISEASGTDTLTVRQPADKSLTLQVSPAGSGRCEGGDLMLGALRFPLKFFMDERQVVCGDLVTFAPPASEKRVGVRAVNRTFKRERSFTLPSSFPRVQIGNVNLTLKTQEAARAIQSIWI